MAATVDLGYGQVLVRRSALHRSSVFIADDVSRRAAVSLVPTGLLPGVILVVVGFATGLVSNCGVVAVLVLAFFGGVVPVSVREWQCRLEGALEYTVPRGLTITSTFLRLGFAVFATTLSPNGLVVAGVLLAETSQLWLPAIGSVLWGMKKNKVVFPAPNESWSESIRYGRGMCFSMVIGALVLNADLLVVGATLTASAVVIFAAGARIVQVYRQLLTWVVQPVGTLLQSVYGRGGLTSIQAAWLRVHPKAVFVFCGLSAISGGAGVLAMPLLLSGFSECDIQVAQEVVIFLAAGTAVSSAHQVGAMAANAVRRPLAVIPAQILWAVLRAILAGFAGIQWGVTAAAAAVLVATMVVEPYYQLRIGRACEFDGRVLIRSALFPAYIFSCLILLAVGILHVFNFVSAAVSLLALGGVLCSSARSLIITARESKDTKHA